MFPSAFLAPSGGIREERFSGRAKAQSPRRPKVESVIYQLFPLAMLPSLNQFPWQLTREYLFATAKSYNLITYSVSRFGKTCGKRGIFENSSQIPQPVVNLERRFYYFTCCKLGAKTTFSFDFSFDFFFDVSNSVLGGGSLKMFELFRQHASMLTQAAEVSFLYVSVSVSLPVRRSICLFVCLVSARSCSFSGSRSARARHPTACVYS
jgi:hypothetical protein